MGGRVAGGAEFWPALLYFIKAYVGPGCLSLPLAFQNAGLGLGIWTLVILSACVTYNLRTLVLCKRQFAGAVTYADVADRALGPWGRRTIELLVNLVQLGVCAVYFDFFGENVNALLPKGAVGPRTLMVCVFPVYGALALLKTVDSIAPYAALANALIFVAIGIVFFSAAAAYRDADGDARYAMAKPSSLPLFFGTVVYSFEGVCSMLPIENAMKDPADIFPVLYYGMVVVTATYGSVGAFCYVAWPRVSSGSITAEIAAVEHDSAWESAGPVVANVATVVAVIFTFPVQLFPALELLEGHFFFAARSRERRRSMAYGVVGDEPAVELAVRNPMVEDEEAPVALDSLDDAFEDVALDSPTTGAPPSPDGVPEDVVVVDNPLHPPATPEPPPTPAETSRMISQPAVGDADADAASGDGEETKEAAPEAEGRRETMPWPRVGFRLAVVLAVFCAAAAVPDLGALISLLGALTGSVLSLIAPGLINWRCPRPDRRQWEPYADVAVVIVGALGGVFGTYQAALNVVRDPDAMDGGS